jgi:glycosyltransferase involved in cell wall biosynthesis
LLFAGSGQMSGTLRRTTRVLYDEGGRRNAETPPQPAIQLPTASFAGFLNQTEISQAYVAADCLVLPSDHGETWGLVVNEAMASGLPCVISDHCGCAEDLGIRGQNQIFPCGDIAALANGLTRLAGLGEAAPVSSAALAEFTIDTTVKSIVEAYRSNAATCFKAQNGKAISSSDHLGVQAAGTDS